MRKVKIFKLFMLLPLSLILGLMASCVKSDDIEQPQLSVSDKDLKFANQIGETIVTVNTNCKEWIATTPKSWMHLTKNGNEIAVKVDANTTGAERNGYILVDGGLAVEKISVTQRAAGKSSEVVVKQPGVSTFILACNPGTPFSLHKMMDFEYRRGSILKEYGGPDVGNGLYEESYIFKTSSPLFKEVFYVHDTQYFTPTRIFTRSLVKEGVDAVRSQAFQDFVKANGYERDSKDTNHYVNQNELITMDVDVMERNNSVVLFFYQMHVQDRDYATFNSLDLGPLELLNKTDKKITAVEEYETAKNSEEVTRQVSRNREIEAVVYKTTDPLVVSRTYFFYTRGGDSPAPADKIGSVEQYSLSISQPNLGLWQHGREWFITREFDKLLTSNNFEFVGYNGKHHVYARRSDYLTLAISGGKFSDVNNGQPVMQLSVLYKPTVFAGSKQATMEKVEQMLKKHNTGK